MRKFSKFTALALTLIMLLGMVPAFAATGAKQADIRTELASSATVNDADPNETVTVIVELAGETTLDRDDFVSEFKSSSVGFSADKTVAAYRADLVEYQESVQGLISVMVPNATFKFHYTNLLNGFSARVQRKDIDAIRSIDGVVDVYEAQTYNVPDEWKSADEVVSVNGVDAINSDSGSVSQMGLQAAWDRGFTGKGKVVAVFDSSLRYTHELFQYMDPAITAEKPGNYKTQENLLAAIDANKDTINLFKSGWGSWFHEREESGFPEEIQAKIKEGEFWYNEKVPFAVDYMDGDLEVWDGDTGSHGTHVAGISAGNPGPLDPAKPVAMDNVNGVLGGAYDSQIMFFKVFSEHDDFGQESDEAVFAALDDAVTLGVNAFNLSLGIPNGFNTMNTYAQAGYQKAYNRAAAAGISIAVSAGNDTRDGNSGNLLGSAYSTVIPNSYSLGFSGSLFSPFTVASASGAGYSYLSTYNETTMKAVDKGNSEILSLALTDNNATAVGDALDGTYTIVDVGFGQEEDILAATGATELEGALAGKVAMVTRGGPSGVSVTFLQKGENAHKAGAVGMILFNNTSRNETLSAGQIFGEIPTFGMIPSGNKAAFTTALAAGDVTVSFTSEEKTRTVSSGGNDNGPSSFTSWGVTESLRLKPDIMTPGGNILSAGASSDTALSVKSGTSMASPNMEGAFILVQQYVDQCIENKIFDVKPGTQAYTDLVNQLVGSTARPYKAGPNGSSNKYFSPRRQGAGMANIDAATSGLVILHNDVAVNAITGEAPRTKVDLFDKLGDSFEFSFQLDNYNAEARTFDVLACLQTDQSTVGSNGRTNIVASNNNGTDIDAIDSAVITVAKVSGDAKIDTDSENINRYNTAAAPAKVTVPANSKTTVTVSVKLDADDMEFRDKAFPNGMFLEGYVFFDSDKEDVNIPFLGFRGDWTKAPLFDLATLYDDISDRGILDLDYPFFNVMGMSSRLPDDSETLLGANMFASGEFDNAWPGYVSTSAYNRVRSFVSNLKTEKAFSGDFSAISPNEDGYSDIAYANLALLRNTKALGVVIVDTDDNIVRKVGTDFDFFEAHQGDGNETQQIAATYGTKYKRDLAWDGTDDAEAVVEDGQYFYRVIGMTEYEYLNTFKGKEDSATADEVMEALLASETAQFLQMPVKVDTTAPSILADPIADGKWKLKVEDESGIQAIAFYYGDTRVGDIILVNDTSYETELDIGKLAGTFGMLGQTKIDPTKFEVQAVDFAFNLSKMTADQSKEDVQVKFDVGEGAFEDTDPSGTYKPGQTITLPNAAYDYLILKSWNDGETTYAAGDEFTVPEEDVTLTAVFGTKFVDVPDLPANAYYTVPVAWAVAKGITSGTGENPDTFSPEDICTRGQVVTFLWRAMGKPEPTSTTNPFTDVKESDYFYKAVLWAVEKEITTGTSATTFEPEANCTRGQVATFLWRAAGKPTPASSENPFTDVKEGEYYYDAVLWAVEKKITSGTSATTFEPNAECQRAQIVTFLHRWQNPTTPTP